MTELAIVASVMLLPVYVHVLAKVAARAWYKERLRYQNLFMNELQKEAM